MFILSYVHPNIKTFFSCNVYRLLFILLTVISQCIVLYELSGNFFIMDNPINEIDFFDENDLEHN